MENKIPAFLLSRKNTTSLILFTALFALLFINLFKPFDSRSWYPDISDFKYFFFSSLIILTGMLVVVVSRVIMLVRAKNNVINYLNYILWVVAEILAMSLFYTLFSIFVPKEGSTASFIPLFKESVVNTSLVILIPYTMAWLYMSWKEKTRQLENLQKNESAADSESPKKGIVPFHDEKGELKISIMLENLLYMESADNYLTIYYLNKEKIVHFVLRNSLKWMEENLSTELPLVRCHRSYMVNLDRVKVMKKGKEGIILELDALHTPDLPVSRTYYERVMKKFSAYSY